MTPTAPPSAEDTLLAGARTIAELPRAPGWLPLVGHALRLNRDTLAFLEAARDHAPAVRVQLLSFEVILISTPALVEQVLVTHHRSFLKDRYAQELRKVLGDGLLTSESDFWLRQRRLAQPAFHKERIASYGRVMVEATETHLASWPVDEEFDLSAALSLLTLEIVGKTLFGADVTSQASEIAHGLEDIMARFSDPMAMIIPHFDKLPLPMNRRFDDAVVRLDRVVRTLIEERRQRGSLDGDDLMATYLSARDDAGEGMSDTQLRDEVLTLVLAGHETTALALGWTLLLLAQHPEVCTRLRAELGEVLGDRSPTVADLPRLRYTDAVFKESMRLYPPAWSTGREAAEEVTVGGLLLPKGTQVWLAPWAIQRNPEYFPDPTRFDPSRWEAERARRLPRFAYSPFGGGPRMCIGTAFAQMEGVLLLAAIVQRREVTLAPGQSVETDPAITLRPKHPIRARLTRLPAIGPA
jgi:cytochrome P450